MFKKFYISYIIFSVIISLIFSINKNNITSTSFIYPTKYTDISSYFGYRELFGKTNYHDGTDFLAPQGSEIYAINSGVVIHVGFLNGYGNSVIILHDNGLKSLYGHMSKNYTINLGDSVLKGDTIGYVGPKYLEDGRLNGNTTGPHLHLTIYDKNGTRIDPLKIIEKK